MQVGTNGYFTFQYFTSFSPFIFNENITQSLVAPFFTDIDISYGVGQIDYEIHTVTTSQSILSEVNSLINEHTQTEFNGEWLLVATWDNVPPFGFSFDNSVRKCSFVCVIQTYTLILPTDKYIPGNNSYRLLKVVFHFHILLR